jgi:hypothetical protein
MKCVLIAASVAAVSSMAVPWQNTMPFLMNMQRAVKTGSFTQQVLVGSTAPQGTKMGFMLPYLMMAEDSNGKNDAVMMSMMQNGAGAGSATSLMDMWLWDANIEDPKTDNDLMKDIMIMNMRAKATGQPPADLKSILPYMMMKDTNKNKVNNNDLSMMLALQQNSGKSGYGTQGQMMNSFLPYMLLNDKSGATGKTNLGLMAMAGGLGSTAGSSSPLLMNMFMKDSDSNQNDKDMMMMMAMRNPSGTNDVNSMLPYVLSKDSTTTTPGPNKLAWAYSQAAGMIG